MLARSALVVTPQACRAELSAMPDPGLGPDSGLGGFGEDFDFPQLPAAKQGLI
jgi:hypothetical protein